MEGRLEGWKSGRLTRIFWITGLCQDKREEWKRGRKIGRMEEWKGGRWKGGRLEGVNYADSYMV